MDACYVPSKALVTDCLRSYKRCLASSRWKLGSKAIYDDMDELNGARDTDEFFCVVNMYFCSVSKVMKSHCARMCALCKLIVFGYNSLERRNVDVEDKNRQFSMATLVEALPIGTKSDVANALLETLESCMLLWRRRFDRLLFALNLGKDIYPTDSIAAAKTSYLKHNKPCFPSAKILKLLCSKLPIEKSVEGVLEKSFGVANIFSKDI